MITKKDEKSTGIWKYFLFLNQNTGQDCRNPSNIKYLEYPELWI
jgi:hypothetical protein